MSAIDGGCYVPETGAFFARAKTTKIWAALSLVYAALNVLGIFYVWLALSLITGSPVDSKNRAYLINKFITRCTEIIFDSGRGGPGKV
jgi:hypothetical protein